MHYLLTNAFANSNKSTLESAQKGRQPALLKEVLVVQPLPIPDEDMVFADHGLMERMSPSLKDTYGGLPVARYDSLIISHITFNSRLLEDILYATDPGHRGARLLSTPLFTQHPSSSIPTG